MAKFTLDDLAKVADPKEEAKALSTFQNITAKYFLDFSKDIKAGDRLTPEQAEKFAEGLVKLAVTEYMKQYQGIDNPQLQDINAIAQGMLGMSPTKLKLSLQNRPLTLDGVGELGKEVATHVLESKRGEAGARLQDVLLDSKGDFRKQFDDYLKSKGFELDSAKLQMITPQEVFTAYSILNRQQEGLTQVFGDNVKPYKKV